MNPPLFLKALSLFLLLFLSYTTQVQAQCATGREPIHKGNASIERQVLDLVNRERAKQKLKPVAWDENLANAARFHAKHMSDNNYFDHQTCQRQGKTLRKGCRFNERVRKFVPKSIFPRSENIAKGQRSPAEVMRSWMNSPGHRKNILDPQSKTLGVGFFNGYWVQNFGM